MLELEVEVVKKWVLRLASGFQKEGSRAGVPIGCQTSAPSRGSKRMRKPGVSLFFHLFSRTLALILSFIVITLIIIIVEIVMNDGHDIRVHRSV